MSGRKILIDTNVFIGLEDEGEVAPELSEMLRACAEFRVRVFVHEASLEDIGRDRDSARRRVSLSKLQKFERIEGIHLPPRLTLEQRFGSIGKPNDTVDVALLHALEIGVVDFLVTQDQGIHARARRRDAALANRTLTVVDAVAWLRTTFAPKSVGLPFVQEVKAHSIRLEDDIFDSLRVGYPNFDSWWQQKCIGEHRPCWIVTIGSALAGLIVRKDETHAQAGTQHIGPKILKICTFKVKPAFRGEKFGELLLKQTLWFAQRNRYDLVYVTTFPDQDVLVQVLEYFGFEKTGTNSSGEWIYEKSLARTRLSPAPGENLFLLARTNYPRFVSREPASAFCIPIQSEYHNVLFPELARRDLTRRGQPDLFQATDGVGPLSGGPRLPGNTIRKVYLCRAQTQSLRPGSVLVFYRSKSPGYLFSQCVTSLGVVESVSTAENEEQLVRMTAKRSVYTTQQLSELSRQSKRPVKVIDFLLIGHLEPPIPLKDLLREGVFEGGPPQSISSLPPSRFEAVRRRMDFGYEV